MIIKPVPKSDRAMAKAEATMWGGNQLRAKNEAKEIVRIVPIALIRLSMITGKNQAQFRGRIVVAQ